MKRSQAVLVGAVLVLSGLSTGTVRADDSLDPPVITSPAADATVAGEFQITATSSAAFVLFRLHDSRGVYVQRLPVSASPDGSFSTTLPAEGLSRRISIDAVACASADISSCTTVSEGVRVSHDPLPMLGPGMPAKQVLDPRVTKARINVPADVATDNLWLSPVSQFNVLDPERIRLTATGAQDVDVRALSTHEFELWLTRCSPVLPSLCERPWFEQVAPGPWLVVRRGLKAMLSTRDTVQVGSLNQNGDGFAEQEYFWLKPDPAVPFRSGSWRLLDRRGRTVVGPVSLATDALAGTSAITLDPRSRLGRPLADGAYTFSVTATAREEDYAQTVTYRRGVAVWNSPSLLKVRTETSTFNPVSDGFRDYAEIDSIFKVRNITLFKVLRADGTVVRTDRPPWIRAWDGRTRTGHLASEGRYRFSFRVETPAGDAKTFQTPLFNLSHKRLVTKTFRKTVTAKASLVANRSGRCARGLRADSSGAIRYLSRSCRPFIEKGSRATGVHQLRLPKGNWLALKMAVTGHSIGSDQGHLINLLQPRGRRYIDTLTSGRGTWWVGLNPQEVLPADRRFRWIFETIFGNEFRVRTFTVVYRYRVLR